MRRWQRPMHGIFSNLIHITTAKYYYNRFGSNVTLHTVQHANETVSYRTTLEFYINEVVKMAISSHSFVLYGTLFEWMHGRVNCDSRNWSQTFVHARHPLLKKLGPASLAKALQKSHTVSLPAQVLLGHHGSDQQIECQSESIAMSITFALIWLHFAATSIWCTMAYIILHPT